MDIMPIIIEPDFEVIDGTALQGCALIPRAIGIGAVVLHVYFGNNVTAIGHSLAVLTIHSLWWLSIFVII